MTYHHCIPLWMVAIFSLLIAPIINAQTPPPGVDFVWWQDPNENAFAIQIPQGWQVVGGMLDILGNKRLSLSLSSPDNHTLITIGTNSLELMLIPSPELQALGFSEGDLLLREQGFIMAVAPFLTGAKAAQQMAEIYIAPNCNAFEITNTYDYERQQTETQIAIAGEVQFKCTPSNNVTYSGYFYANTVAQAVEGLGYVWTMDTFYGIVTLPNNLILAAQVLQYMGQSVVINPEWIVQQTENAPQIQQTVQAFIAQQSTEDALLDELLLQIMNMSLETSLAIIYSMDGSYQYEYEFLP